MNRTLDNVELEAKHILSLQNFGVCSVFVNDSLALGCFGVEIERLFKLKRVDSEIALCHVRMLALQSEKSVDAVSLIFQSVLPR